MCARAAREIPLLMVSGFADRVKQAGRIWRPEASEKVLFHPMDEDLSVGAPLIAHRVEPCARKEEIEDAPHHIRQNAREPRPG